MDIRVTDKRLKAALEDRGLCKRRYGPAMMKELALRLAALRAADSLAGFWPPLSGPERCHELKGDRSGQFSMDLKQPYRLLFKLVESGQASAGNPDERQRWKSITAVDILGIEDTHG